MDMRIGPSAGDWNGTCTSHLLEGRVYLRGLMRLSLRAITLMVFLLAAAGAASASGITLTLNSGGSDVMGGVYVGPYSFTTTTGGDPSTLQLICDDYSHEVYIGESWTANTSTLPTTGTTTTGLQFSASSTLTQYEEAAWLAQQIFALGPVTTSNAATIGFLQYALWDIFDPGASSGLYDPNGQVAYWLGQAQTATANNCANCNFSDVVIYTPNSGSQIPQGDGLPQEYIGIVSTPEPGSLLLLGTSLIGLFAFRRKLSY
jgi:PEP-CTERM motif